MKLLEKRIARLEFEYLNDPKRDGIYMEEVCFLAAFARKYPNLEEAPRFLLAEYRRTSQRLGCQTTEFPPDKRASRNEPEGECG
jgi:hypothetical protein